jgi:transposase-like protein
MLWNMYITVTHGVIKIRCPFCKSDNYHFIEVSDFDESGATLHFKCLQCDKDFYGVYSFLYFEDDDGNEVIGYES